MSLQPVQLSSTRPPANVAPLAQPASARASRRRCVQEETERPRFMKLSPARTLAITPSPRSWLFSPSGQIPIPLPSPKPSSRSPVRASQIKANSSQTNQVPATRQAPPPAQPSGKVIFQRSARCRWRHRQHHRPRRQARPRNQPMPQSVADADRQSVAIYRSRSRCPSQYCRRNNLPPARLVTFHNTGKSPLSAHSAPNLLVTELGAHPHRRPRSLLPGGHHQLRFRPHRPASRGCHPP